MNLREFSDVLERAIEELPQRYFERLPKLVYWYNEMKVAHSDDYTIEVYNEIIDLLQQNGQSEAVTHLIIKMILSKEE